MQFPADRMGSKSVHAAAILIALGSLASTQTAFAAAIKFRPGAAQACDVNVNRMDSTGTLADLDQYQDLNSFEWAVVNDSLPASTGLPDDKHVFFDVNSSTNTLPVGATFNTAFTMRLLTNGAGGAIYGLDSAAGSIYTDNTRMTLAGAPVRYPTHVFMTASMQGSLRALRGIGGTPVLDLVKSNPLFSQGRFRMFFDADGDLATTTDQVLIAKFGTVSAPDPLSSFASTTFIDKGTASVIVNWDSALPGVFADANGNEIATTTVDATDQFLRVVSPATSSTAKVEIDFKFECATTGVCTVLNVNTLRFRLNMTQGHSTVSAIPTSTTPAAALCPNKIPRPDSSDATCFPFAFCPFPYFGILVLTIVALVVVVVVIVVVKKVSQRAQ